MLFSDLPIGAEFRLTESVLPALIWVKVDAEHASTKGRRERWIQEDAKVSVISREEETCST